MKNCIKSIELGWIVVRDIKKAKDFYVNKLGFELTTDTPEYNWAEVKAPNSNFIIGIGQASDESDSYGAQVGTNTVLTFTVDDLEKSMKELAAQGVQFKGEVMEVPGHVKMVSMVDPDGNHFQLVQKLW